ncbi:MAG: hypothetical protein U0931_27445 [Vulcanimicrobiota bacterium]
MSCTLKKAFVGLFLCSLTWAEPSVPAAQFDWPTSYTRVRLVSIPVDCNWREGRPFAPRDQVARILKLTQEGSADIDLIDDQALVATPPAQTSVARPGETRVSPI